MNVSKNEKAKILMGEEKNLEKKAEELLGRPTFIKKPESLIETQFLDLQKTKKYKVESIGQNNPQKQINKKINSDKNKSLNMYSTDKSLKINCRRVLYYLQTIKKYLFSVMMKKKWQKKSF